MILIFLLLVLSSLIILRAIVEYIATTYLAFQNYRKLKMDKNYWNEYYKLHGEDKEISDPSSFAKFIFKKISF